MSAAVKQSSLEARFDQLAWYYHRLRAMDGVEVAHRVGEAAKRRLSRFSRFDWGAFDLGDGPVPAFAPRSDAFDIVPSERMAQWRPLVDAARCGSVTLLGQSWPADRSAQRWHRDPVTGENWPARSYCFDIPYRRERKLGDIKYVWELNRLQFLQPVAVLAAKEHDVALGRFCLEEIESWIDANPPFRGVNWASGIELALRVVSILVVLGLVGEDVATPAQRRKFRACLNAHAYWLARYPSRHSSANNHLIAECAALFLLGTLWPELGIAHRVESARAELIGEIERQIHEDGVGAEQSPTYTAFTLEWYLLCAEVAARAGTPLPKSVTKKLGEAGQFLRWITDEGGNVPRIGDDDEGRVLADGPGEQGAYVGSILGSIAATLKRPNLAPPRVAPSLRNLYFGLPAVCPSGPKGAKTFSQGGYSVCRRRIAERKAMMVMDHGPLGHLSIAAHGHADALALWLHIDDQPVLVDAGTYLYHSGGAWRDRFRGTGLHNTLCLDGQDSSRIAGPFNWSRKAHCERIAWKSKPHVAEARVRHDGYAASHGLVHERHLVAHAKGFSVRDVLVGERPADTPAPAVAVSFLVHPDLDVRVEGNTATIRRNDDVLLRVAGGEGLRLTVHRGSHEPARGWYSERFGSIRPASQLVFTPRDARDVFDVELEVMAPSPRKRCGTKRDGSGAASAR